MQQQYVFDREGLLSVIRAAFAHGIELAVAGQQAQQHEQVLWKLREWLRYIIEIDPIAPAELPAGVLEKCLWGDDQPNSGWIELALERINNEKAEG